MVSKVKLKYRDRVEICKEMRDHLLSKEIFAVSIHISTVPMGFSGSIDVVEELHPLVIWPGLSVERRQPHAAIAQGRNLRTILAQLSGRDLSCATSHCADRGQEVVRGISEQLRS